MQVDVNNLRKKAVKCYEKMVRTLNADLDIAEREYGSRGSFYDLKPYDIQQELDDLRMYLGVIAAIYIDGDENFKDLSEEVGDILSFNADK